MIQPHIHFQWSGRAIPARRAGVSLHSHTLHSKESLDFIYRAARHSALLRHVVRKGEARFREHHGVAMDLRRGWWTPPLAPADAQAVEEGQIAGLGLTPIVSLTDHDDLEAPMLLQAMAPGRDIPISTEWTVPFGPTFFHLGIHNLPSGRARAVMAELAAFTAHPADDRLAPMLAWLDALPGTLVVFNHPLWDEKGVGEDLHGEAASRFLGRNRRWVHGIEMNGLRPWPENQRAIQLAREWNLPVVSGGDRHAIEPNANINLTQAATFAEFAEEVRNGHSEVLVMAHYRQSYANRIFHNLVDVLQTYPGHGRGWRRWQDRVFYTEPDGGVRSLGEIWGAQMPAAVDWFQRIVRACGAPPFRSATRYAGANRYACAMDHSSSADPAPLTSKDHEALVAPAAYRNSAGAKLWRD